MIKISDNVSSLKPEYLKLQYKKVHTYVKTLDHKDQIEKNFNEDQYRQTGRIRVQEILKKKSFSRQEIKIAKDF
jgi:hypothetical protein